MIYWSRDTSESKGEEKGVGGREMGIEQSAERSWQKAVGSKQSRVQSQNFRPLALGYKL